MRVSLASLALSAVMATSALAQQAATPPPKGPAEPQAKPRAKVEQVTRCQRDLRGVGSMIGKRTCQTRSEGEAKLEDKTEQAVQEAARENAQQFLSGSLVVPSMANGPRN